MLLRLLVIAWCVTKPTPQTVWGEQKSFEFWQGSSSCLVVPQLHSDPPTTRMLHDGTCAVHLAAIDGVECGVELKPCRASSHPAVYTCSFFNLRSQVREVLLTWHFDPNLTSKNKISHSGILFSCTLYIQCTENTFYPLKILVIFLSSVSQVKAIWPTAVVSAPQELWLYQSQESV